MWGKFQRGAVPVLLFLIMTSISCGVVIKDPGDINGTGEVALVFEVTGSVSSAGLTLRGNDGGVLLGTEAADGTITPETVTLPWTSEEYAYTGMENVFFSVSAKNTERQEQAAGILTTYSDNLLIDAGAQYTSYVSVGDYAYNEDDGISAIITAVNSDTECTLSRVFFAESWRIYYIHQAGSTIASGTTTDTYTGPPPYKLIDSTASFGNKVDEDKDTASNQDDETEADITSVVAPDTLGVNPDIFTVGEHYLIRRDDDSVKITGNPSDTEDYCLKDDTVDFSDIGVVAGLAVENTDTENFAQVISVSDHELTLDRHIFTSTGDTYLIYPVKSSASHSTTQTGSKLIDSSASYWEGVKAGDVIYNPDRDIYGKVTNIVAGTELDLDNDVFPSVNISYKIYAPRTLTVTVYADGEEYDSFTSTHWDIVEAALTGVIDTTE